MKQRTAYIIGAGEVCFTGFHPGPHDLVIAADGGYDALHEAGIRPHLLLGDMDSIKALPTDIPRLRFPARKDETDMALAIKVAQQRGFRRFKLYGALGGRLDHTLANLQLLGSLAHQGMQARIVDRRAVLFAVCKRTLVLPPLRQGTTVSVFAWGGDAAGVTLKGLAFPLYNAQLEAFMPLGVSNVAKGMPIRISVSSGVLLVTVSLRNSA